MAYDPSLLPFCFFSLQPVLPRMPPMLRTSGIMVAGTLTNEGGSPFITFHKEKWHDTHLSIATSIPRSGSPLCEHWEERWWYYGGIYPVGSGSAPTYDGYFMDDGSCMSLPCLRDGKLWGSRFWSDLEVLIKQDCWKADPSEGWKLVDINWSWEGISQRMLLASEVTSSDDIVRYFSLRFWGQN